jgi:hypothetical protein
MNYSNSSHYNIQFLKNLYDDADDNSYEKLKIIDEIDSNISQISGKKPFIFHLVPIIYSLTITTGFGIFLYKIMML